MSTCIDRTPKPCLHPKVKHQHGTHLAYVSDRCRCLPCAYAAYVERSSEQSLHEGLLVRDYVHKLNALGMSGPAIATAAGLNYCTIGRLLNSTGRQAPTVRRSTAAAILAITPQAASRLDRGLVARAGTRRRLQALGAIGWRQEDIAARLSITTAAIRSLMRHDGQVCATSAAKVADAYDAMWRNPPTGASSDRRRRRATTLGWASPLAWDDDTIDDPRARPDVGGRSPVRGVGERDELAILRAVTCGDVELTRIERVEAVRLLHRLRLNDRQIGRQVGIHRDQVARYRRVLGLPANHTPGRRTA